ncbi:hypothetical protein ACIBHY_08720 [Nonomuraea sp. NPDC050547]|uniref:hypothetical protein n=1 Tax=Nonomuraea sp. NPDC050547 TaxID=3364368 RepID=UPI00378A05A7
MGRLSVLSLCVLLLSLIAVLPAQAATTRYEAENATSVRGVAEANHPGFSGTGFVNSDNAAGPYTEWTVRAPAAAARTSTGSPSAERAAPTARRPPRPPVRA